jgi:anti-sigma factor RsiW
MRYQDSAQPLLPDDQVAPLLLYLAGELAEPQRGQLERRLAVEPALSAQLEQLRHLHEHTQGLLLTLDRLDDDFSAESAAVRQISRLMRQWQTRRQLAPSVPQVAHGVHWPWWAYPISAAAMLLIGVLAWWATPRTPGVPPGSIRQSVVEVVPPSNPTVYADALARSFEPSEPTQILMDAQSQLDNLDATYGPW